MLEMNMIRNQDLLLEEQRDDELIEAIAGADEEIVNFFTDEFVIKDNFNREHTVMFPYLSKVLEIMIREKNPMVEEILDKAIKHNRDAFELLEHQLDEYSDYLLQERYHWMNDDFISDEKREQIRKTAREEARWNFNYNNNYGIVSYYYSKEKRERDGMATNLIIVTAESKKEVIAKKIRELNEWAEKTVNLGNEKV